MIRALLCLLLLAAPAAAQSRDPGLVGIRGLTVVVSGSCFADTAAVRVRVESQLRAAKVSTFTTITDTATQAQLELRCAHVIWSAAKATIFVVELIASRPARVAGVPGLQLAGVWGPRIDVPVVAAGAPTAVALGQSVERVVAAYLRAQREAR